jgi:hypothetical protein
VAQAVILYMKGRQSPVERSAAKLHADLAAHAGEDLSLKDDKTWPKTGRTLWKKIREVTPLLEAHGIRAYRSSSNKKGRPIILDPDFTSGEDPDGDRSKKGDDKGDDNRPPGDDKFTTSSPNDADTYQNGDDNGSGGRYSSDTLGFYASIKKDEEGQGESKPDLSSPSSPGPLEVFFSEPPKWVLNQLVTYINDPQERLLKPLCAAVAYEVFGDPRRAPEVRSYVENLREKMEAGVS